MVVTYFPSTLIFYLWIIVMPLLVFIRKRSSLNITAPFNPHYTVKDFGIKKVGL
jgi:hypothetical protein